MEKYIVFGPIIIFFGFFFLLILGFFVLVGKLVFKAKGDSWKGEVIDKVDFEKKDDDTKRIEHLLSFKVRLDNGEVHSIATSGKFYNEVKVGDRLEKRKGELWPRKI
jgi:hypothetical protein